MTSMPPIAGHVSAPFERVREAFVENFVARGDVGASVAIFLRGEPVVDLFGGWTDAERTRLWTADTLVNVWSATKGVMASCFAMLVDRGQADYADPVAMFWPEFAEAQKSTVTIGQLLSHQAGLCGFTEPATLADLLGGSAAAARLSRQAPLWTLGDGAGYHAITIGILGTELFRRIEGRSLRDFVAAELRSARGLDISIGLGERDEGRRADLIAPPELHSAHMGQPTPVQVAALANPSLDPLIPNTMAWRQADLPSANGHTNARGLAELYSLLIAEKHPLISNQTLAAATDVQIDSVDKVLDLRVRWGAGFLVNSDGIYGENPSTFGHSGWGGSFAFADPSTGLAMAYAMNRMGTQLRDDPRDVALISAAYAALR